MSTIPAPSEEHDRIRILLTQAVVSLCNVGLSFNSELTVEGLLGITLDRKNVVMVNIKEIVQGAQGSFLPKYAHWPTMAPHLGSLLRTMDARPIPASKSRSSARKGPFPKRKRGRPRKIKQKSPEPQSVLDEVEENANADSSEGEDDIADSHGEEDSGGQSIADISGQNSSFHSEGDKQHRGRKRAKSCENTTLPEDLVLPDPEETPEKADLIRYVNQAVAEAHERRTEMKRRRGEYNVYSPELRARIGEHAAEFGIVSAARHFTSELGRTISESTVRAMKKQYRQAQEEQGGIVTELPHGTRGRKSILQKYYDDEIMEYVDNLRRNGGAVNPQIVMDAARGILLHHDKLLLKEYGGPIELSRSWAESFLKRMAEKEEQGEEFMPESVFPVENMQGATQPTTENNAMPMEQSLVNEQPLNMLSMAETQVITQQAIQATLMQGQHHPGTLLHQFPPQHTNHHNIPTSLPQQPHLGLSQPGGSGNLT